MNHFMIGIQLFEIDYDTSSLLIKMAGRRMSHLSITLFSVRSFQKQWLKATLNKVLEEERQWRGHTYLFSADGGYGQRHCMGSSY